MRERIVKTKEDTPILILGAGGMLGHALTHVISNTVSRGKELDITDRDRIISFITKLKPAIVINAAAYTDVEGCEEHADIAMRVNGIAPSYLAEACRKVDAKLIHYSTDYVFDGEKTAYTEEDSPNPLNAYGRSKLLGEQKIMETMENYYIIRTSWLYGPHGKNFVDTMLELSRTQQLVKVVNDQFGRPTYTLDLAQATQMVISYSPGIYHLTNDGTCSWYDFARAIIPNVVPCNTDEYPRKANRPKNSTLVSIKVPPLRHWRDALADYLSTKGLNILE